jgi:acyl-CoA synthetase (AMP-forming)/AMP-acid ligase II
VRRDDLSFSRPVSARRQRSRWWRPGAQIRRWQGAARGGARRRPWRASGGSPERPVSWLEHEEETISINYTSGTTGRPKGVQYTYRGAYLNALGEVIHAGLSAESVYLWTLPMFHCNGWCFPWAVTAVAARHVTLRAVDPKLIWELIDGEGVTHYNGAPTVQLMVPNHPRAHRLERPVTAMVAAAPPSPTPLGRMSELNLRVVHVYGLTETYGPITVSPELEGWRDLPVAQRARHLARQGQGYVCADLVRVVDGQMRDVTQDGQAMGEVVMRGNNVMSGYFHDDAATSKAFTGGRMRGRRDPAPLLGRAAEGIRHPQRGRHGDTRGDHRVLPGPSRPLQVPRRGRARAAAEDLYRQGAEIRAARPGMGGARQADRRNLSRGPKRPRRPLDATDWLPYSSNQSVATSRRASWDFLIGSSGPWTSLTRRRRCGPR